jgi:hypothetical protein
MALQCLQVCAVLLYAQQNNVEPFLEPVLQLADTMMARDASDMAAGASSGQLLQCFLGQLLCFMDLCTHPDAAVGVAASQCLAQLVGAGTGRDHVCALPQKTKFVWHDDWGAHMQQFAATLSPAGGQLALQLAVQHRLWGSSTVMDLCCAHTR